MQSVANLYGAKYGNFEIKKAPILIDTQIYDVIIFDNHIIGCELHTHKEWSEFTLKRIAEMDSLKARRFWKIWKKPLLDICEIQRKDV